MTDDEIGREVTQMLTVSGETNGKPYKAVWHTDVVRWIAAITSLMQQRDEALGKLDANQKAFSALSLALGNPALEFDDDKTLEQALVEAAVLRIEDYKEGWDKCDDAWAQEVEEMESRLDAMTKERDLLARSPYDATELNSLRSRLGDALTLVKEIAEYRVIPRDWQARATKLLDVERQSQNTWCPRCGLVFEPKPHNPAQGAAVVIEDDLS